MIVLVLGPYRANIDDFLRSYSDNAVFQSNPISLKDRDVQQADFIVSYGYRHIISPDIVDHFRDRAINLHISYLPWNRGADPNLWSFLEDTPKGVSIHKIARGLDTGDIITQQELTFGQNETLATTYRQLTISIERLFFEIWPAVRGGVTTAYPQRGKGSYHRAKDKEPFLHLLRLGWDTPVNELIGKALLGTREGGMNG
ncbi:formyltransferase family protein [Alicyclobacillus macrosporangiidus]|uniref:formyltransferase family protein n=1 Tax=Alicyclobacillus macrosporangiidus TaxID=392015 RepID=UPI0009DCBDC0|nr:formyltransferase family protein [Alicyclobacillus macrosporangiidus]